jgi:flavin-dependent dehydrogenase
MTSAEKNKRIVIIGGGPAGSSLAIRLVEAGFEVTLAEREKFPRHKLCGEFISPECLLHFEELGVREQMLAPGGARISKTIFYEPSGRSVEVPSTWFGTGGAALSLSRAEMDLTLLERAKDVGAAVFESTSVNGLIVADGHVKALKVHEENGDSGNLEGDIFIDATGRSRILARLIEKREGNAKKPAGKNGLVGFKAHLKNASVKPGCCEIYSFPGGYGGLSPIEDKLANHCFLVRPEIVREMKGDADKIVETAVYKNQRAFAALNGSQKVGDWLAVSVDGFGIKNLSPASNVFTIGDAAAFVDPFTGSGMLMALESSELLARLVRNHSSDLAELAANYRAAFDRQFRLRMRVCSLLRHAAFSPAIAKVVISVLGASGVFRRLLTGATRSNEKLIER